MEDDNIKRLKIKIERSKRLLLKYQIYKFLHEPIQTLSKIYHIFSFLLIFACLFLTIFPAIDVFFYKWPLLEILEYIILIWFAAEFGLNFWACDCRPQYQGYRGRVKYLVIPTHLIELIIVVLSAVIALAVEHEGYEIFAFQTVRGFNRFFQVLEVLTLRRQLHPWKLFFSILHHQRRQILLVVYLELLLITSLSYIVYALEHETNESFPNYLEALWWAVETLSTTGYGDRVPKTAFGKIVSGFFLILSVALFALQGTVIGVGWALKVEEMEKDKMFTHKRNVAARVIQNAWKCSWESRIYEALQNTFGYLDGTGANLLKERLHEQAAHLFYALLNFNVARTKLCELRRPMELKNIIESQKFEKNVIKLKMKQVSDKIENMLNKLGVPENEQLNLENLTERFLILKQMHLSVQHCPVCCEKIRKRKEKAETVNQKQIEMPNDVYATITSLISESSFKASPLLLKRVLRESIYQQPSQEISDPENKPRKDSIFKRTRRRFSQWTQRK